MISAPNRARRVKGFFIVLWRCWQMSEPKNKPLVRLKTTLTVWKIASHGKGFES
jgi:hypothetical protein